MKSCGSIYQIIFLIGCVNWSMQDTEINVLKRIFSNSHSDLRTMIPPRVNETSDELVPVYVNLFVRSIDKLDDRTMELKAQVVLRMTWLDSRLSYQNIEEMKNQAIECVTFTDTSKIWIPDLYFMAERQVHDHNIMSPSMFARVYPNGTVLYSRRISVTQSCPMDLKDFPFDSQMCSFRLASYKGERISLQWKKQEPVQLPEDLHLMHFTLEKFKVHRIEPKNSTGEYALLSIDLYVNRDFFYYFKKFYIPVINVVLISWIPLWLERVLILRIYIAISTVVFLGWHYTVQDIDLVISYNTPINSWNAANFIFVILAALESIMITFMIKTNKNAIKRVHPDDSDEFKMIATGPNKRQIYEVCDEKTEIDAEIMKIKTNFKICFINVHKEVQIIDAAAKLFFPSSYILFLFFYWIAY